jgi:hypothetical protein
VRNSAVIMVAGETEDVVRAEVAEGEPVVEVVDHGLREKETSMPDSEAVGMGYHGTVLQVAG